MVKKNNNTILNRSAVKKNIKKCQQKIRKIQLEEYGADKPVLRLTRRCIDTIVSALDTSLREIVDLVDVVVKKNNAIVATKEDFELVLHLILGRAAVICG